MSSNDNGEPGMASACRACHIAGARDFNHRRCDKNVFLFFFHLSSHWSSKQLFLGLAVHGCGVAHIVSSHSHKIGTKCSLEGGTAAMSLIGVSRVFFGFKNLTGRIVNII